MIVTIGFGLVFCVCTTTGAVLAMSGDLGRAKWAALAAVWAFVELVAVEGGA